MSDLMTGRVDSMLNTTGSLLQAVRSGQVRGLGVTSEQRFAAAPELPPIAEAGLPGFDVTSWYGLFLPGRTPEEIKQKIHTAVADMLGQQAVRARFETLGIVPSGSTPAELSARAQADVAFWEPIIKGAGIRSE